MHGALKWKGNEARARHWLKFLFCVWILITANCNATAGTSTASEASTNSDRLISNLYQAIRSNDVESVRAILKLQPSLADARMIFNKAYNNIGEPLIISAAQQTNLEIVKLFLDAGATAAVKDDNNSTPLSDIVRPRLDFYGGRFSDRKPSESDLQERLTIAGLLAEHGNSIFIVPYGRFGGSPIEDAAMAGDGELVDALLIHEKPATLTDEAGNSPLFLAALWARTNALKVLAGEKINWEATNAAGWTPLQTVSRLPDYQADPRLNSIMSYRGVFGMAAVGIENHENTARLMIELGAPVDIFSAAALGWTNTVAELLAANPKLITRQNGSGQTVLHWVAELGETNMTRWLLQWGAPVDGTNWQGQTPLEVAAKRGWAEVTEVLVEHGAVAVRHPGTKTPLHWASEQGNAPLLLVLLNGGADQETEDQNHRTALDVAAMNNHEALVTLLLARHARLKTGGNNVTTPLHSAIGNNNTNLIEILLRKGCDLNARNDEGKPGLFIACENNNFSLIEFLLARGADINGRDCAGNTALHERVLAEPDLVPPPGSQYQWQHPGMTDPNARSMMEFLIRHGAQVNAKNLAGRTPLHLAAQKFFTGANSNEAAMLWLQPLLANKADINARDTNGCTPLHLAVQAINLPVMAALMRAGADVNAQDKSGKTPLHWVMKVIEPRGDGLPFIEALMKNGAKVNIADRNGDTPLHLVVEKFVAFDGDHPVVAWLLAHGANVNAVDKAGRTPLHLAASVELTSHSNIFWEYKLHLMGDPTGIFGLSFHAPYVVDNTCSVNQLLENGADANIRDHEGNTALHYAALKNHVDYVQLLLKHLANRHIQNHEGKTPLQLAYEAAGGYPLIPVLQPDNVTGEIASAARRGDLVMVKEFLKEEPNSANWPWLFNSTPLQWAANDGHIDVVRTLLKSGAKVDPPKRALNLQTRILEMNSYLNEMLAENNRLWPAGSSNISYKESSYYTHDGTNSETTSFSSWFAWASTMTPLQLALAGGHSDMAKLLVKHGATVDLASAATLGLTSTIKAALRAKPQSINEIFRRENWFYEPYPDGFVFGPQDDKQSGTLLHFAVRAGRKKTVEFLLKAGADKLALNDDLKTPYQLALETGQTELAAMLK